MTSRTADKQLLADSKEGTNPVLRKVWLPKFLYDSLPYFYLLSGILALLTTLYIDEWFWVVPHYFLFSAACVHFGVLLFRRRGREESP
jgi:hypothetical protein